MHRHSAMPDAGADLESEDSSTVFSRPNLVILIISTLVLSYWMVPSNEEAARRLLNDGQVQRAAAVIRNDGNAVIEPHIETLSDDDRLNLLEAMLQPESRTNDVAAQTRKFHHLLSGLSDLSKAQAIIDEHLEDLDKSVASSLFLSLGDMASDRADPAEAGRAYAKATEAMPANGSVILKIVQNWRAQNNPGRALAALENWLNNNDPSAVEKEGMLALHISLLRENSQSGRAFDLVLPTLKEPLTEEAVTLVEKLAGESSRTKDAVPVMVKFFESTGTGRAMISPELDVAVAEPLPEDLHNHAQLLASFYEWQDEPGKAFSLHYKLARQGDRDSLKRCIALYDGLDRENDLCQLLQSLPTRLLKPTEERLLARLLSHSGDSTAATAHYETYLKSHPEDVEAISELASIHSAEGDLQGACDLIERALKKAPHNRALLTEFGELLISTGSPHEALPVYEELSRDPKDDEAMERFALLAENLGEPALLAEALTRQIAAIDKPCPDLQLALVRTISQLDDGESNAASYLTEAVKESPDQPSLRLALARMLVETPQAEDAVPLLATNDLANSGEGIELLCEAVQNGASAHRVADFFKAHPESISLKISPEYLESRRQIVSGDAVKSDQGTEVRSAADEQEELLVQLRQQAENSFRYGNNAEAYTKLTAYFEKTPFAHPADWNLLGHIYKSMGQSEKSRKAFQKSLQPLTPTPAAVTTMRASEAPAIP